MGDENQIDVNEQNEATSTITSGYSEETRTQPDEKSAETESVTISAVNAYQIKPTLFGKFKAEPVKEVIRSVLNDVLGGKSYQPDHVSKWTIEISNEVSSRIMELNMKRYKHVVQVTLGESKGAGVKSVVKCLWDSDTDGYTSEIYMSDSIFCLVAVYAIYFY